MRRALTVALGTSTLLAATMFGFEGDAKACGGCFGPPPPPNEQPTIVTDHRMLFSIAKDQATLYDQIKYQGSPSSFAWVLPIVGSVDVGLSADVVFQSLDQLTTTTIVAPPQNCPQQPTNCNQRGAFNASAPSEGDSAGSGGTVTVIKQEVVGPYETVQLQATDPQALENWLTQNGFNLPPDVKPVVDQYVTANFNFLALKLIPGKGIQDMRPVRVTTQGSSVALPLRMVAAGTGATVGITLWVLSEGRYEPQNFPNFVISADDLFWDWTQNKSNYTELRATKTAQGNGKAWEIESSTLLDQSTIQNYVYRGYYNGSGADPSYQEQQAEQDYLPAKDSNGTVTKTAVQVRDDDLATMFHGIGAATSRVTRMRADLAHTALTDDLLLTASANQDVLSNIRNVTHESNEPLCPVYQGCTQVGTAPRSQAQAQSTGGNESFSCSTTEKKAPAGLSLLGAGLGTLALVVGKLVRRRRARS
jgi:hypothetical protein